MKKLFVSVCMAFAIFAMVSCSNSAIKTTEDFIDDPTFENCEKMKKAIESLSDKEKEEYEIWYADHIKEILEATQKMTNRLDLEDEDLEVEEW